MGKYSPNEHSFRLVVCLVATILLLSSSVSSNVCASRYAAMSMQPRTTVATPPVILQSGTTGTNTIYTNNTSAKVSVAAPISGDGWGPWSDELLVNPGFEMGNLSEWTAMGPAAASVGVFSATSGGDSYTQKNLRIGNYGVCTLDSPGTSDDSGAWQNVSVAAYAYAIDCGNAVINASGWLYPSEWTWDDCALIVRFYNSSGGFISAWNTTGEYGSGTAYNPKAWMLGSGYAHFTQGQLKQFGCYNYTLPPGTRIAGIQLGMGEHKNTAYCGGQADEASIRIRVKSLPVYYPNDHSITSGNWWSSNYGYRKRIVIDNNVASSLSAGYSVLSTVDTSLLVSAGKMLSNGNDLRVVYWNSSTSSWLELDRDIENMNTASTRIWFKTQADIAAFGVDTNHYVYYSYPGAGSPPANRGNVYVFWDDFESGTLNKWSIQSGAWAVATDQKFSGTYSLKHGPDGSVVYWIKPSTSVTEKDVMLESYWRGADGSLDFAQAARVQSGASKNWYETNVEGGSGWDIARYVNDGWTEMISNGGSFSANNWYKVTLIVVGSTQAKVLVNDTQVTPSSGWSEIGTYFTSPGTIAIRTGIINTAAWVDNVKLRKYVDPEPSTSLDLEEQNYFVSGTVPESVQNVDSNYFIVRSASSATSTTAHNPSNYNLLGNTTLVSGTTSNLISNNDVYMQYRSCLSIVPTAKTDAFVAYRDSTTSLNMPKERTWTGDTTAWSPQGTLPTSGSPVRFVRVAYSPIESRSYEKIVVTLSDDGYLDAYVWNGTSWEVTNNIGNVGTVANAYKSFDVVYETTSGEALLVYSVVSTDAAQDLAYKTWIFGTGWSAEGYIDDTGHATDIVYRWISMASNPVSGSNEITMVAMDGTDSDANGWVWGGSSWGSMYELDANVAINTEECIAVAYEQTSGRAWTAVGSATTANTFDMRSQTGGTWNATKENPNVGGVPNWCTLKADPASNYLLLVSVDGSTDLNTVYYTGGSAWAVHTEHDGAVDTNARRCADFAWESTGNKGLLVWGTSAGAIAYKTFTAPNTWSSQQNPSMGSSTHLWVQLRTNPRSISGDLKILGVVLEGTNFDIGAISWDGSTFTVIGSDIISADTTLITYECFEVEFENFTPKQFVSEIELTGTSNTESWNELVWSLDSAWTIGSVTVTIQVYNYTGAGEYPTSGLGFRNYTSSSTANTDETMTGTIVTNPTHFRDGSGNWKIKVKGVSKIMTQFDFNADWVEFKPSHYSEYTASSEFSFSSMTENTPTQLNFTLVSEYDVAGVSVTIQVWNYSSSAYVTSGEGYQTYSSSGANETRLISINTNPQFYSSSGNAKIKITGVLTSATQHQQRVNQLKLVYSYNSSSTYDYVLRVVNQVSDSFQISLQAYQSSNIARVSNMTVTFHDGSSSDQVIISNGSVTQSEGTPYNLVGSATTYISISNLQASTAGISTLNVYLKSRVPNTTTRILYTITFEIT